jgi:hypothetical protein
MWWKKACSHLNIEEVDMYGGSRHSSSRELHRIGYSREEIRKEGTQHSTTWAFDRYLGVELELSRTLYSAAGNRGGKEMVKEKDPTKLGKVLKLKE